MSKNPYKKMMKSDPYWKASERALRANAAELGRVQGDLNSYVAAGDKDSAAACVTELANLSRQQENLQLLRNQYLQSRTPPQQAPQTREEWQAKPVEHMNYDDALKVFQESKYGKNLDWNDANMRAGYQEAMRRRQRGE
jgi:hypothetical protein